MIPQERQLWQRHENDESRRLSLLASKRKYASKKWTCELCNRTINISNKSYHMKSKIHLKNLC